MLAGQSLRSHRTLEGEKAYRLHQLDGQSVLIKKETVDALRRKRLIETNNKFPTATYFLTGKGRETASKLTDSFDAKPLTGRGDSAH